MHEHRIQRSEAEIKERLDPTSGAYQLCKKWMPEASDEVLAEAIYNLREYLKVVYRIYLRLEREKHPERHDEYQEPFC